MASLAKQFMEEYLNYMDVSIHHDTARRMLHREKISRKVITRRNIRQNPADAYAYLVWVSHICASRFVDIDGLVQSPRDFHDRYGWSPVGEVCNMVQITIGTNCKLSYHGCLLLVGISCLFYIWRDGYSIWSCSFHFCSNKAFPTILWCDFYS